MAVLLLTGVVLSWPGVMAPNIGPTTSPTPSLSIDRSHPEDAIMKCEQSLYRYSSQDYPDGIRASSAVEAYGDKEDLNHECIRTCERGAQPKKCYYKFLVEWYVTMSKACYDCPHNVTDCLRPHCAPGDGQERPLVAVNRRLPGPSIQVCKDDEIIVDVQNELMSDGTVIHWHGIHQIATPYMDGVPFLTQCPIMPGTTFRYHFLADLPGTHFWHSHSGFQRTDGMFGSIVVRSSLDEDVHGTLFDVDDPLHVFVVTDWMDSMGINKFVKYLHSEEEGEPYNILVNGRGKWKPLEKDGKKSLSPIQEYRVKKGLRYRFRSISSTIENCPIEMSIQHHKLLVIASDGQDIEPINVETLTIYTGERWDFVVETNQPVGVYWFNFRGLLECGNRFLSAHQVALIRYDGAEGFPGPVQNVTYDMTKREGLVLNKPNAGPGDFKTFLTAADVRSHKPKFDLDVYRRTPDRTLWLDFDYNGKDNDLFHHKDFYPFFGVEKKFRQHILQVNEISLKLPNAPPLSQPEDVDPKVFCNAATHTNCNQTFCHCTHTLHFETGNLVEFILVDRGLKYESNHPFHIHGHVFAVLGMARLGEETTLEAVQELEREGKLQRNFENPPLKDTVTVPDGGYTVIRFIADNPGYWLFHCHISFHVEAGMGLVIHTGEQSEIPPVPPGFPKCGHFKPPVVENLQEQVRMLQSRNPQLHLRGDKEEKEYNTKYDIQKGTAVE